MIRIFIGASANNEDLESQAVLEYTLRKYASEPLEIIWMQQSRDPKSFWHGWNTSGWATPFSGFRFGIPAACNFEGRAVYMDSDMIVMHDIAELGNWPLPDGAVMASKGNARYCVTMFDNARCRPHMIEIEELKTRAKSYRDLRTVFQKPGMIAAFPPDKNWNCCDGEKLALGDPAMRCLHYTAMNYQPQLPHAIPRLKAAGLQHWFRGEVKPHWRPEITALFSQVLAEAIKAGYLPSNYEKEPFGDYVDCGGGGWINPGARQRAAMGK